MEGIGLKTGGNRSRAILELSKVSSRWCQRCKMRWLNGEAPGVRSIEQYLIES